MCSQRIRQADRSERNLAGLLELAAQRGYLLYDEIVDALPTDSASADAIDDARATLAQFGVTILGHPGGANPVLPLAGPSCDEAVTLAEDDGVPGVFSSPVAASTDPLALFTSRMHAVPPLTRDEETGIAQAIAKGRSEVLHAIAGVSSLVRAALDETVAAHPLAEAELSELQHGLSALRRAWRCGSVDSSTARNAQTRLAALLERAGWESPLVDLVKDDAAITALAQLASARMHKLGPWRCRACKPGRHMYCGCASASAVARRSIDPADVARVNRAFITSQPFSHPEHEELASKAAATAAKAAGC